MFVFVRDCDSIEDGKVRGKYYDAWTNAASGTTDIDTQW